MTDTEEPKVEPIKFNCSFCGKPLETTMCHPSDKEHPLEKLMIHGGAVNWFTCGFGSCHDTDTFLLAICDDCLSKANPLANYNYMYADGPFVGKEAPEHGKILLPGVSKLIGVSTKYGKIMSPAEGFSGCHYCKHRRGSIYVDPSNPVVVDMSNTAYCLGFGMVLETTNKYEKRSCFEPFEDSEEKKDV